MVVGLLVALAGCGGNSSCKDGTVLLTVTYDGAAAAAASVDVSLTVDGAAMPSTQPGTPASIEVDFANYPGARTPIQVVVTAKASNGSVVGTGSATAILNPSCTVVSVEVQAASPPDLQSTDQASSGGDMSSPDLRQPNSGDMSRPDGSPDMRRICIVGTDTFNDGCVLGQ
jgi:hypothetical protein